ncbi:MAG: hypothetical protein ACOYEV_13370 [Candidatus Nanopelagicales bacterium]
MTRNSLRTLPETLAELVGRHLAAAGEMIEQDPQLALEHARAAARLAARVAVVREAVGIAAYSAGEFAEALTALKAAARISGSSEYLPMIADCERGLGRPQRALALAASPEAGTLDRAGKVEMLIVAAGARRDLGQDEAAVLTLQVPALKARTQADWLARLRYAYADALLAVGRGEEAQAWFARAAAVDPEGRTDAQERLDELSGLVFEIDESGEDSSIEDSSIAADDAEVVTGPEFRVGHGSTAGGPSLDE